MTAGDTTALHTAEPRMAGCSPGKKVSVLMITYNHERFIAQAIESVLMQVTDFAYEIVVGDDCSTDRTRAIVADYASRYPDKIRPLFLDTNLGATRNFARTFLACEGQYVAILDGDDYWLSPDKLQRQVDFLDAHPDSAICHHNARVLADDGAVDPYLYHPHPLSETSTLEDLLRGNFISACSVMLRRGPVRELPPAFHALRSGDWTLTSLHAQHGNISYLNEVMAAYRVHGGGVWSGIDRLGQMQAKWDVLAYLSAHLDAAHAPQARALLAELSGHLGWQYALRGDYHTAKQYTGPFIRARVAKLKILDRVFFRILIGVYHPSLFRALRTVLRSARKVSGKVASGAG